VNTNASANRRVVTTDCSGAVTVHTDWLTYGQCQRYILARWGHWPPWAFVSRASGERLRRLYGFDR